MSDLKQEIFWPNSGLNTDDDIKFMQSGDSPLRRNILVGEDETGGLITQMLGNTRTVDISDHELYLSHTYKVIGSYYNRLTRIVYYFVWGHPYEIESTGTSTSSTTTTTTTTTEAPGGGLEIDYTAGDFQYDNMLLAYYEDSQTLDVIFRDPKNYFGLHWDYPMRDICMIGNWLYFNPRVSEPKMIDVEMAYNYTNYDAYGATTGYVYGQYVTFYGGLFRANQDIAFGETPSTDADKWDRIGDSYADTVSFAFDSEFRYAFNVLKQPPLYRPTSVYDYDAERPVNNVKNLVFRFSYRHKYFDDSYSAYSAYSDVSLPSNVEHYNGEIDTIADNFIHVKIFLPSAALVKEIEIVFQIIGESTWRRAKIVNRRDIDILTDTIYTYDFYNDESYLIVDSSEVAVVYDDVPKKTNSQEIINKNILCYGGVTEGFDNIDKNKIDVTLLPEMLGFVTPVSVGTVRRDNIHWGDITYTSRSVVIAPRVNQLIHITTISFDSWYATSGIIEGDIYSVMIDAGRREGIGTDEHSYTIQAADVLSIDAFVTAIGNFLSGIYTAYTFILDLVNHTITIESAGRVITILESKFYISTGGVNPILYKRRGFKTGAWHPFCLFYYDGMGRRWDAQTSEEIIDGIVAYQVEGTTVYVPSFNEISPELPVDTANRWVINWEINHLPPEGAKYWRWGYAGNSLCSWFVQYIISDIDDEIADPPDSVRITITPFQQLKVDTTDSGLDNQFPQSIIDPYDWVKGDRIRFITQTSVGADMGALVDGMYDFEIIKFDVDNDYIYIQDFEWAAAGIGADSLAEIYRPLRVNTETKYYEFGELYPITEDSIGNAVHGSDIQDQDTNLNLPAVGVFDNGDVFHILRTPSKAIDGEEGYFHESQWWSDFYESDEWDIGKIGVETTFNERYLNIIRYSFPYFQNTEINGLPVFRSNQYKELNDIFGNIVAIYEVGDTLKVYQERKASSIQMGRIERIDETGQISVSSSSVVLGSIRYSPSNYSTVFPESISRNNKYIYGFDIYNGVMWRDSVNGIFPISGRYADPGGDSDYKMATWFKDKSKDLLVSGIGHCDVMSVWDEEFKNLHVVFKDYNEELNDATIVFHEPSNRWICFQDLDQTPLSHNVIVECKEYTIVQGFEGGLGYSFDEDTRFAVFDILTPGNKVLTMPLITMNMTAYEPSVQADGIPEGSLVSVGMTAYTPTVHISYVSVDVNNISWNADAYGVSASSTINVTTTENAAVLTSMPAWMTGKNHLLHTLIVGVSTIPDGENMYLYPATQNTGADRTGSVILTDSYGNTASITVTQWGVPDVPEVILEVKSGETFTITDSTPINTYINNGSNQLHIGFTAHDLTLPGGVLLDVEVIKNSVHYMWTNTYGRNEFYLTDTIVLAHTAVASDVYLVILDEP